MNKELRAYLGAAELRGWTVETYLTRHRQALVRELAAQVKAGNVVPVRSKNGGVAYKEKL